MSSTILVLILVLFLLSLLYASFSNILNSYRLGDFVKQVGLYQDSSFRWFYCLHHKNTIAHQYNRKTSKRNDYSTLYKLTQTDEKNELCIHLRLGDVIDNHPENVDTFLNTTVIGSYSADGKTLQEPNVNYVKPLAYYQNIIKKLKYSYPEIDKVLFVSGSHLNTNYPEKSQEYIKKLKLEFEKNGYIVTVRWNKNADEDFKLMSNSKIFCKADGGYSNLIKEMVLLNKNVVLEK